MSRDLVFTCPNCGGHSLGYEAVVVYDAYLSLFESEEVMVDVELDNPEELDAGRYICHDCSWSCDNSVEWMMEKGWINR